VSSGVATNGERAYRKGEYFHYALNVPNSTAQYPTVTVVSQYGGGQTETGKVFVPPSTEAFTHDADGNLTSDGRWTYSWDGENRLVQMIRDSDSPTGARQKLVFEYDHQGRRIRKQFYSGSDWQEQTDTIFLYEGWNLIAELNANAGNARVRTYVWGTDLSGSMQGAGGVGGLLKLTYYDTSTTNAFVAYDGNGNVTALIDAAIGNACARYQYGPFAEPIRSSGPLPKLNPLRFSTKYTDTESGFLYYGYRYYNPSTGRWLSRDPLGQRVGEPLYSLAFNSPVEEWDYLGLFVVKYVGDGPYWVPKTELFWAALSFAFDPSDVRSLGKAVTVLVKETTTVEVTPCSTSAKEKSATSTRWFIQNLDLNDRGRVENQRPGYDVTGQWAFELGWFGHDSENAYRYMGGKTKAPTSGFYSTSVEYAIGARGSFGSAPTATVSGTDWLHNESPVYPSMPPSIGTFPHNHPGWLMLSQPPSGGNGNMAGAGWMSISFSWDNCCGRQQWGFVDCGDRRLGTGGKTISGKPLSLDKDVVLLLRKPHN